MTNASMIGRKFLRPRYFLNKTIRCHALSAVTLLLSLIPGTLWAQQAGLDIEISGVSGSMLKAVHDHLSIYGQRKEPLLNDALIRGLHRKAGDEIRRALRPFGYYRATVDSELRRVEGGWLARYDITPGEPIRLEDVDISIEGEGANDRALQRWREQFPLQPGDILQHQPYEEAKQDLRQAARDHGYVDGKLTQHRIVVDLDKYRASITLHYKTGPRYTFGTVQFDQEAFAEEFLQRYLTFRPGEPYEAGKLLDLQRVLTDSDYFKRVDVSPLIDQASEQRIPIRITLTARDRKRYTAGIGYATDTGARGMLGFENRRANRWGHRYEATLRKSGIDSSLTTRYHVPMKRPATDFLTYTASWVDEETDTVERTTSAVAADLTQQTGRWQRNVGLSYEIERYRLNTNNNSTLLIPHVRWLRVSTDRRIHTRHGWLFSVEFRGADENILSDTSFFQTRSNAKYIQGVTEHTRLLLRTSLGASWTRKFIELPASQRFFAGGDQSIRGYTFESLGPRDETGTVIGGRHLAVGSAEYEMDLTGSTALAAFFDAGNAFDNDGLDVKRGTGIGLRWRTPVGAIRVDLARALDKSGKPWRVHLTLGPDL